MKKAPEATLSKGIGGWFIRVIKGNALNCKEIRHFAGFSAMAIAVPGTGHREFLSPYILGFSTFTNSCTESALFFNFACSSAVSLIS
jgi:hypothetical protein